MFILIVAISIVLACLAYVTISVVLVMMTNYKAHQFFKTRAPKLPVPPNPNIFSGHAYSVALRDKNCLTIDKLHEQLGPTFGFYFADQPWVATKDLDLIKLVELDKPALHTNRANLHWPFKEFSESIFQVHDEKWRRQRRAIAPALTNHRVRHEQVTADIEAILALVKEGIEFRMTEDDGQRSTILDVSNMCHRYTLAVIFTVVYECDGQIDFRADKDFWSNRLDQDAKALNHPLVALSMMFPFIRSSMEFLIQFHSTGQITNRLVEFIVKPIVKNQASMANGTSVKASSDSKRTDDNKRRLMNPVMDALVEKRITRNEFVSGLYFLLLAGFKTTADTITSLVWHLARYPDIQEQLRHSILERGTDSAYLDWCVKEAIRIHPAVPLGAGRFLGEDVTVNGLFLPKGAYIMPSTYSVHHDPNIWPEPNEFKPERWNDTSGHHPAAFVGFGLGPRNCLGAKLAVLEIKLITQLLLTNYRIEKCSATPDEYSFSSPMMIFTTLDRPIMVKLVPLAKA